MGRIVYRKEKKFKKEDEYIECDFKVISDRGDTY